MEKEWVWIYKIIAYWRFHGSVRYVPKGHILLVINRVVAGACWTAKLAMSINFPDIFKADDDDDDSLGVVVVEKYDLGVVVLANAENAVTPEPTKKKGAIIGIRRGRRNTMLLLFYY